MNEPRERTELGIQLGIVPTYLFGGSEPLRCQGSKCHREIRPATEHFIDTKTNRVLCEACGKSLRYARKKAAEQGRPLPLTSE